MKKRNENYFYQLKLVAENRLSPDDGIVAWFIIVMLISGLVCGTWVAYKVSAVGWTLLVKLNLAQLALQFIATIFFIFTRNTFRFQRLQSVILCIIVTKFSVESYQIFYAVCIVKHAPDFLIHMGTFLFFGGIVYLILSIKRGFGRVQAGHLRQGGKGLFDFKGSKGYVILPAIYIITLVGAGIVKTFSLELLQTYEYLLLIALQQYLFAMILPEFFLLAYAKFRFPSFIIEIPKPRTTHGDARQIQGAPPIPFKDSLRYWYNKPLSIMKSWAGWKSQNKAPFWTSIIVWLQVSALLFAVFLPIYIIDLAKGSMNFDEFIEGVHALAVSALVISLVFVICVRILLGLLKMFMKVYKRRKQNEN